MILAERAARLEAEMRARDAEAEVLGVRLEIERLRLLLARMRRERFGQSSECGARLIEQLELQLADLEESAAEEEAAAEITAPASERRTRSGGTRKPARRPLPDNLPRERIVYPAPCACPKCGGESAPTSCPRVSINAPPELPGLMGASVWMKSS